MTTDLASLGQRLVRFGEKLGADEVEVYIEESKSRGVTLVGKVEAFGSSHFTGLGIRVVNGRRIGLSSTTSLNIREAEEAVRRAHSIAKVSEPIGDWVSFAKNTGKMSVEGVFDPALQKLPPETMSEAALEMVRMVREQSTGLSITRGGVLTGIRTVTIVNSHNQALERRESYASASISVTTGDGDAKGVSSESDVTRSWRDLDAVGVCHRASQRAVNAGKARPIPSGTIPVIWRNRLFAGVLSIMFGGTLSAEAVQRRRSPWADKIGSKIATDNLTLIDEGLLAGGIGTREFDDEGVAQRRVPLIEEGVLMGCFYDTLTADKDRVESTGNASRGYDSAPRPAPNNLSLTPGTASFDETVKETKNGLYLEELIGVWLSNPISGYLSATVANAMLIEKGELTRPVKGVLVSGNFFEILRGGVDLIGRDVDHAGNSYSPTVRVASMSVTTQ